MDIPKIEILAGERGGVLIVDDTPAKLVALAAIVSGMELEIVTATSGEQALRQLLKRDFAVILLDVIMPTMDGFETATLIRSRPRSVHTPIIFVTAEANSETERFRGYTLGAVDFIYSPIIPEILRTKVQVFVDLFCLQRQLLLHVEELKARQQELVHSNQVLNGLYRIAEGLNQAASEQEVAELALQRALELPGVQFGWIILRQGESRFQLAAGCNLPPTLASPGALEGDCLCRRRLLAGEFDAVTNIMECARLKVKGDLQGLRYHASVPLQLGGRTLGVMNLTGPQERLFDEEELKILHGVGNQVAVALERARLHGHLEQLVEERTAALTEEIAERKRAEVRVMRLNRMYAVLSGINTTIIRVRDRQELFVEACRIAVERGQFGMAWIGMLDPKTLDVTPAAVVTMTGIDAPELFTMRLNVRGDLPQGQGETGRAIREKTPVFSNDISVEPGIGGARRKAAIQSGFRSVIALPLQVGGEVVGNLTLFAKEPNFFDAAEIKLLTELAGDISFALDHLEKEERLNYLAYYDVLTGLPNRALFHDRLNQLLHAAKKQGEKDRERKVAVLLLDLERFHTINDTLGRIAADDLLKQVAERLSGGRLDPDHRARINADIFAAVLGDIERDEEAVHFVEQGVIALLHQPFSVDGQELRISAKAGIALFPADGADADSLLRNAEAALEKAKLSGDKYLFYTPEINARVAETLTLENKLRRALEQKQLVLHYQPKVNLKNGQISGLEALMRWNDPEAGLVPPVKFIPILEETGLILEAGRWALEQAVADFRRWQANGLAVPRISVNVSAIQLRQKEFVAMVERALSGAADAAGVLELEITESLIMQDVEANIQKLKAIRDMGVEVAIDDFGTGYSSLSYIARLPINTLKIDRAFIMNLPRNPGDVSIVTTIISLAHSLNLKVVAEGVETEEQAKLLALLKCDEMQGYLFSPAVPAEQVEIYLREKKSLSSYSISHSLSK